MRPYCAGPRHGRLSAGADPQCQGGASASGSKSWLRWTMAGGLPTPFRSLPVSMCSNNPKIVERLKENGRLLGPGRSTTRIPIAGGAKQPVIFRATEQWFVSMETNDLRQEALAEIDRCGGFRPTA